MFLFFFSLSLSVSLNTGTSIQCVKDWTLCHFKVGKYRHWSFLTSPSQNSRYRSDLKVICSCTATTNNLPHTHPLFFSLFFFYFWLLFLFSFFLFPLYVYVCRGGVVVFFYKQASSGFGCNGVKNVSACKLYYRCWYKQPKLIVRVKDYDNGHTKLLVIPVLRGSVTCFTLPLSEEYDANVSTPRICWLVFRPNNKCQE